MATLGPYYEFIVRRSVRQVSKSLEGAVPSGIEALHYGANYIDPKHLAIWFLVPTNADLARAKAAGLEDRVRADTSAALTRNEYSAAAVPQVHVGLESRENVEKGGGAHLYFH